MAIDPEFIEELLYRDEGEALDFKRDQYPFSGASDEEKAELLKDILAFANSWRREDAHIVIGVAHAPGQRGEVVGVSEHIDDARLQQFVNSKTQRPLSFRYCTVEIEDKSLGIIHIPLQDRPLFLKGDYGRLKKDAVYVRRGSSTAVANPEEIAKMGHARHESQIARPVLDVAFYDQEAMKGIGVSATLNTVNVELPAHNEIPDFSSFSGGPWYMRALRLPPDNRDYWRELGEHQQAHCRQQRVDFIVTNSGSAAALDVRLTFEIEDSSDTLYLSDASSMPDVPEKNAYGFASNLRFRDPDITVQRTTNKWVVKVLVGKVQPGGNTHTDNGLFIGARQKTDLSLRLTIRADNLSAPQSQELKLRIEPESASLSLDQLTPIRR